MITEIREILRYKFFGKANQLGRQFDVPVLPPGLPKDVCDTYGQAWYLLESKPRASSALSRYCLQEIIRDFWQLPAKEHGSIAEELDRISKNLPEETRILLDCVRNFETLEAQLAENRDLILDTTVSEARILAVLVQMLIREWYEERRQRQMHLEVIRSLVRNADEFTA